MEKSFLKKREKKILAQGKLLNCLVGVLLTSNLQLLVSYPLRAQDQLASYIKIATQNNPRLQALLKEYQASLEEIPQAGALPDPQLTLATFLLPVETRVGAQRASVAVSQMLPWFGTLNAQEQVAAERAKIKLYQLEDAKQELFQRIKTTYNELYYLQAATKITRENLTILGSFKELARVNFEGAQTGFTDVLRAEIEEEALRNKLQYLEESYEPLVKQFEQLLNQNLIKPLSLPDSIGTEELLITKDSVFQVILANNPQLEALRHEVQAYQGQANVVEKMGLPSFTLGGSYVNIAPRTDTEVPDNGRDAVLFPQVGIRLPVYRKKYDALETQAQLQREATLLREESRQDQLRTQVENLYRDYRDAQRRVVMNRRLVDLARRTLSLLQTEFTTGEADFEEVIQIERQLLDYQLQLERAKVERNNYVYQVHYLMGK
ncbi:MAG: TolC family protein [Bacteroidota bacterium]